MTPSNAKRTTRGKSQAGKTGQRGARSGFRPKAATKASSGESEVSASRLIDQRIRELGGWRGATLARMRALILEADPGMTEEWKWKVPVWSHDGIVCTGEAYKNVVKLTFARGASIPDPAGLFNSSLEGNTRRAIDIHEGETVDASAFKALVKAAVGRNGPSAKKARPGANKARKQAREVGKATVALLSGGNPQIAKGEGDAPVQKYIAAMPGWKRDVGKRLDALIVQNVPDVRKAVKWNSPFYGIEGQGWFLNFHCFTKYVKVAFFRGTSLRPVPPGESRHPQVRYFDIHEGEPLDEARFSAWVKQASQLPGERM